MANDHIPALQNLRIGVEADRHNLDDGTEKLAALDAAIEALTVVQQDAPTDAELPLEIRRAVVTAIVASWEAGKAFSARADNWQELNAAKDAAETDLRALLARYAPAQDAERAERLHTFLNAAAGEGVEFDGVAADDLYIALYPERYAAAVALIDTGAGCRAQRAGKGA